MLQGKTVGQGLPELRSELPPNLQRRTCIPHQALYTAKVGLDDEGFTFSTDPTFVNRLRVKLACEDMPTPADQCVSTALVTDRAGRDACLP